MKETCVLAYSGGLDTSVILGWLIEQGYDVVAVYVDLGQPCEDRQAIMQKARDCGAVDALLVDVREELCRDFAFPVMQWQARYEGTYLLGTSIARPLIAKVCVDVAHRSGAGVFAHGATGKGNDQCRFQLAAEALDPGIRVLAPWRIASFRERFPGRQELIDFCGAKRIPVKASKGKPYSSDENCPLPARIPSVMGRSNVAACLGISAGARLTTILSLGRRKPELTIARATRCVLSRTAVSGRPTSTVEGRAPADTSTSTSTGTASMPKSENVCRWASMRNPFSNGPAGFARRTSPAKPA